MAGLFRASGLVSGIDSSKLIDTMVQIEQRPLDLLRQQQTGFRTQVSLLGDIASKLSTLKTTAEALSTNGTLAVKVDSTNTNFTAISSATATAGSYSIESTTLAVAAKARSQAFTSGSAAVRGGVLTLTIDGTDYNITKTDGDTLDNVALAIRNSGAPVSAVVLSDGTSSYLSITDRDTGYRIGQAPADALAIAETNTGVLGQPIAATITQTAVNASFKVDGLTFTRRSNVVNDAVTGVTLTFKATSATAENLVLSNDVDGTAKNLQKFADSYNEVFRLVQKQMDVTKSSDRSSSLAGDSALRKLAADLQATTSVQVLSAGPVRALADIGVKTARNGTLSVDSTVLSTALTRDAKATNTIFNTASTGIAARDKTLVDAHTNSVDGILTGRQNGLNKSIRQIDEDIDKKQLRLSQFREKLVRQFTAMEKIMSGLKATGNFIEAQNAQLNKK